MDDLLQLTPDRSGQPLQPGVEGDALEGASVRPLSGAEMNALIERAEEGATVSESIGELASMAATLMRAEACMIMLLHSNEDGGIGSGAHVWTGPATAQASHAWAEVGEPLAQRALKSGESVRSVQASGGSKTRTNRKPFTSIPQSIIASPIRVDGEIVGVLAVVSPREVCDQEEVVMAERVAWFVGQALHVVRLRAVLGSVFAQRAIAQEAEHCLRQAVTISAGKSQQLARLLAKSFYREMVKLGLDSGQIIDAATEIISQLTGNLKRHAARRGSRERAVATRKQ